MIGAARQRLKAIAKSRLGPLVAAHQPRRVDLPPSRWGLSVGDNGRLWSGSVDLHELARREGTPLHVVRADLLDRNATAALGPRSTGADGGCDIFYSYKTNPVPGVLRRVHDRGVGAEVISPFELWLALRLGVPPERVVYNGPAKSRDSLRDAIDGGVLAINANSAAEAAMIARLAGERRRTVHLGLRVALPGMWGGQFGIAGDDPVAIDVVRHAMGDPCVELHALHVHRGLTMRDRETFAAYVASVLAFCDRLRAGTGWSPQLLDLGGSLACPSVGPFAERQFRLHRALGTDLLPPDPDDAIALGEASSLAARMVGEHFATVGVEVPRVILEPGRALTGDTQFLLASVVDVKEDGPLPHVVLDAGINIAEPVRDEYHQLFGVTAAGAEATVDYRLVGPICTPADVLYHHWRLPPLASGHVVAIMDTGAYFVPFSTAFSFPRPAIVLQDGDDIVRLRNRERFEDLIGLDLPDL